VWWLAADHPDRPAIVASPSGVTLSFGQLAGRAHQVVHALRKRGIGAGDVIAYALPNDADVLWWQLGLQEAGVHALALNPAWSADEIGSVLEHARASGIVVGHQFAERDTSVTKTSWPAARRPSRKAGSSPRPSPIPPGRPGSPRRYPAAPQAATRR
jgi:long-chain acyl-CoA synthetase